MAKRVGVRTWATFLLAAGLLAGCGLQKQELLGEQSLSPTLQVSNGMAGESSASAGHRESGEQAPQESAQRDEAFVYTTTYRLKVPDEVQVRHDPGDVVFLQRDGKTIGGIQVYSFYAAVQDISRLFPRNSTLLKSQPLENGKAVRYVLERQLPDESADAAGTGEKSVRESHTYFLREPLAYDVWIVEGALPEKTYTSMLNSFRLFHAAETAGDG
ncbi:hypothetical protein [Brevibacillus marinus]|uniref:hypothetical protein n=1 Tax=Brevibacillus marinus TaxID=2496837 RepID=UPI000F82A2AD|nr:hypothetical protein [Brevibacillus marinus]